MTVIDEPARLNEITARFREAGFELRLYESMPGAWDAIWHPHGQGSGLTGARTRGPGPRAVRPSWRPPRARSRKLERTASGG